MEDAGNLQEQKLDAQLIQKQQKLERRSSDIMKQQQSSRQKFQKKNTLPIKPQKQMTSNKSSNQKFENFQTQPLDQYFRQKHIFIIKLFFILASQSVINICFCVSTFNTSFSNFVETKYPLLIVCFVLEVGLLILVLATYNFIKKIWIIVYFLILIQTLCEGYIIGFFCAISQQQYRIVFVLILMTLSMIIGLIIYTKTTRLGFNVSGASLFILFVNLATFALFCKIFESSTSSFMDIQYVYFWCSLGIIIFGFYLAYDISLMVDYERYQLDVGDYAIAIILIHADLLIILFHFIKRLKKHQTIEEDIVHNSFQSEVQQQFDSQSSIQQDSKEVLIQSIENVQISEEQESKKE